MGEDKGALMPISALDIKYWDTVQNVRAQYALGCDTTRKAIQQAGVDKNLYYRALKSRFVQSQLLDEVVARKEAMHVILEETWVPILMNLAEIAGGDVARDAVPAARLLNEIRQELDVEFSPRKEGADQLSVAQQLTRAFLSGGKVTARETTREVTFSAPGQSAFDSASDTAGADATVLEGVWTPVPPESCPDTPQGCPPCESGQGSADSP